MKNVRVWFEKKGSARYISHLDLTHCMARALRMSKLPVWYTEGFNPRVYMSFSMPLSLGTCGERECMDIRLTEDFPLDLLPEKLNEKLPLDIRAFRAAEPAFKLEEIAFADYELTLETGDSAALKAAIEELFSRETVTVMKRSKKGEREFDLRPCFAGMELETTDDKTLLTRLRLPCSVSGGVNPGLLEEALKLYTGERPAVTIVRKRLLKEDFSEIR